MTRLLEKSLLSILLVALAGNLALYGVRAFKIKKIAQFHAIDCTDSWALDLLVSEGTPYAEEEPGTSNDAQILRKAISQQPLMIDAWFALAELEFEQGRDNEAQQILDVLSPAISRVSTWKWDELLLAFDLQDEASFSVCFNFIMNRLPQHIQEASGIALEFWGNWLNILPHVAPENREICLKEIMRSKDVDAALSLWGIMEESSTRPDNKSKLAFCSFLMTNKRLTEAKEVWKNCRQNEPPGIYDGSFELEPLNEAFGWRLGKHPEVIIERSQEAAYLGKYGLHLRFLGTENLAFNHVFQVVPVDPGRRYHLYFTQRSRKLTTDQGVFVEVTGYQCETLHRKIKPIIGDTPWSEEELEISVPDDCEAIAVTLRRQKSLAFDSKISGDYWLDAVRLETL